MRDVASAPPDRAILLRLRGDAADTEAWAVARYAEPDREGPYARVWEISAGQYIQLHSRDIFGWYELPVEYDIVETGGAAPPVQAISAA